MDVCHGKKVINKVRWSVSKQALEGKYRETEVNSFLDSEPVNVFEKATDVVSRSCVVNKAWQNLTLTGDDVVRC